MRRLVVSFVFFAGLLALWQALSSAGLWSPVLLPSPASVGRYLWTNVLNGELPGATLVTARRLFIGYAIGLAIGLPAGFVTARFRMVSDTVGILALGLQTLPSVCWVPLALLWFGQSEAAMQFVVIMGTLWAILIATDGGVRNVPPIYARAARTMGSRRFHTLLFVTLPASLPFVISGMKQGWAFAWRSLMAAEIYVAIIGAFGLGQLLHNGRETLSMDQVIGIMFVIVLVGLLADKLLFAPAERFVHRRWGTGR